MLLASHATFDTPPAVVAAPGPAPQERPQYLHHFVLHAALDAVEEQEWASSGMHLGVVDRFNALQVCARVGGERPPCAGRAA